MRKLFEILQGIAQNAITATISVAVIAVAGTVGTAVFKGGAHGPNAAVEQAGDFPPGMNEGDERHVASAFALGGPAFGAKRASASGSSAPPFANFSDMNNGGADNSMMDPQQGNGNPSPISITDSPVSASLPNTGGADSGSSSAGGDGAASSSTGTTTGTSTGAGTSTDSGTGSGDAAFLPLSSTDTGTNTTANTTVDTSTYTYTGTSVSVSAISPSSGQWPGGTTVTITGVGFSAATPTVTIDSLSCTSVSVASDASLTCVTPSDTNTATAVDIAVTVSGSNGSLLASYIFNDFGSISLLAGSSSDATGASPTGAGSVSSSAALLNGAVDAVGSTSVSTDALAYIADAANYVIKKVDLSTSVVTVLAGSGAATDPVDGNGTSAVLGTVSALDIDGTNLYLSTCGASGIDSTIRLVDLSSASVPVTSLMGDKSGAAATWVDGAGTVARANCIGGITHDSSYVYFVDAGNYVIRQMSKTSPYTVTTIAGTHGTAGTTDANGTSAKFTKPWGLAIYSGVLYVGDGNAIRTVNLTSYQVTTFAGSIGTSGSTDGNGTAARFHLNASGTTGGLLRAVGGTIFAADTGNNSVRKVTTSGVVSTVFGTGTGTDVDGTTAAATTNAPASVFYLPGYGVLFENAYNLRYLY